VSSREKILNRLYRHAGKPQPMPPVWTSWRASGSLAEQFAAALERSGGECIRTATLESAQEKLKALLIEVGAHSAVANREAPLTGLDLPGLAPEITWRYAGEPGDEWRQVCSEADVGVTAAGIALAETGSIILTSGAGKSRLVSSLPPVHIALLAEFAIMPDIHSWLAGQQGDWPANLVLVSGPSKTGDIEQTLTIGVHGPKRLVVILYGDD